MSEAFFIARFFLPRFDELRHGRLVFSESEVLFQRAGSD
jgi:hypothetical protein